MQHKKPAKFKRRQYFIQKEFQFRFILKFCIVLFVGIVISTGLLFLLSKGTLTSSFEQSRLVVKKTAFAILPSVFLSNLITLALITLAAIAVTLLVSHKLAGPLFRFQKELDQIAAGDLTKAVKLREKDQITAMAESLDKMRVSLQSKIVAIKKDVEKIMESASGKETPAELIEQLKQLHQNIETHFEV